MKPAAMSYIPNIPILGIWLLVYYLPGIISVQFDNPELHVALIWFPAGVATAAFLHYAMRHWPVLLLTFIIIDFSVSHPSSEHLIFNMVFAVVSLPSSLAIAWIIKRFSRPGDDINIIFYWFITTILVSLIDSLCFALVFAFETQKAFGQIFWAWFIADISGNFFSTTVIMGFINNRLRPAPLAARHLLLGAIIWVCMVLYTTWAFSGNVNALNFGKATGLRDIVLFTSILLPVVLTAFMTLVCGNRGGALALLTLGSVMIFYADKGIGPLFLKRLHANEALLLVQVYLTATSLFLVFLRVITHNISHMTSGGQLRNQRQAIYQLNLTNGSLSWDNLPPPLAALPLATLNNRQRLIAQLHPGDQARLAMHWRTDAFVHKFPTIRFRLQDAQGDWLHITDSGAVLIDDRGSLVIVGNWSLSS